MEDYNSAKSVVHHMYAHDIWSERFMKFKK